MDLKIKKEFWDKIVSGEKQYEFRKLSKGLESGTYTFVSVEEKEFCSSCNRFGCQDPAESHLLYINEKREIFGTATLTPIAVNPYIRKHLIAKQQMWVHSGKYVFNDINQRVKIIEQLTYDFVTEYYVDKHDFIAYDITDVKEIK